MLNINYDIKKTEIKRMIGLSLSFKAIKCIFKPENMPLSRIRGPDVTLFVICLGRRSTFLQTSQTLMKPTVSSHFVHKLKSRAMRKFSFLSIIAEMFSFFLPASGERSVRNESD